MRGSSVDVADKTEALRRFTNHLVRTRWEEVRQPTSLELKATTVLALSLAESSAKIRSGPPNDDEADTLSDIEDELEEMITGDAVYFGRETVHGRRALHWFVAADHPIRSALEAWAARHADRDVLLTWAPDPRWATADRFR